MRITLDKVRQEAIDGWPVHETGLPARLVHAAERYKIASLGELRAIPERDLLAMRNVGRLSLAQLHAFLSRCDALNRGLLKFPDIPAAFASFLSQDEWSILQARYGLQSYQRAPSRRAATLDSIGRATKRTRERIRQVTAYALEKCGSRWARVCLEPVALRFEKTLAAEGGFAPCDTLRKRLPSERLDRLDACGLLLLLADSQPERFCFYRLLFFQTSLKVLSQVEKDLLACLDSCASPAPAAALKRAVSWPARVDARCLPLLLGALPAVGATRDGRFFLLAKGLKPVLEEVFAPLENGGMPLAALVSRLHAALRPASHKNERGWLAVLKQHPGIRVDSAGLVHLRPRG